MAAPNFDEAAAYPRVAQIRERAAASDWSGIAAILNGVGSAERASLGHAAARAGAGRLARAQLERERLDLTAATVLAADRVEAAWQIRGTRPVPDDVDRFWAGLDEADLVIRDFIVHYPDDATLWSISLTVVRGLELGLSEGQRRYHRLAQLDAQHLFGQLSQLQLLCPKWAGTWDLAHAFATAGSDASVPGSLNPVLEAQVFLEHYLAIPVAEDAQYLAHEGVRRKVYAAAERSIWHSAFEPVHGWVEAMSTFAMAFALLGDRRAVDDAFGRLGDLGSEAPWSLLGTPAEIVQRAKLGQRLVQTR